jgi:amidase
MSELAELCMRPLCEVAELIARRALSLVELTKAELSRIEALDKKLHSYLLVTAGPALAQARRAEQEIGAGGYRGKLHGMPVAVKDLVHMKEVPTTRASTILRGFRPGYDAAVVEKLAAVAVILGKLNLTEFALYGYHPEYEYPVIHGTSTIGRAPPPADPKTRAAIAGGPPTAYGDTRWVAQLRFETGDSRYA